MNNKKKEDFSENIVPALFFGFKISKPKEITADDLKLTKTILKEKNFVHPHLFTSEEIVSKIRNFKESESLNPVLIVSEGRPQEIYKKVGKKTNEEIINLDIIGVDSSVAEALIIKTAEAILNQNGYKKTCVKINNLGGKVDQNRFLKESTNYFRKFIVNLTPDDRQLFKQSVYTLITESKNLEEEIFQNAPKPIDFLNDDSRKHFTEVLDFLESLEVNHEVNSFILGDPNYSSHTVFQITDDDSGKFLAYGSRYNLVAKKIGIRKDIPAISVMIKVKKGKKVTEKKINKIRDAKIYIIQVGNLAKIKVMKIINELRKVNISVKHNIYRDKLSSQIVFAKKYPHDYDIIIGHKESIENCAIIRDSQGRSQKTLKFDDLVECVKNLF